MSTLHALSPLDGRYAKTGKTIARYFSEAALIERRISVMVDWVIFLTQEKIVPMREVSQEEIRKLFLLKNDFSALGGVQIVKDIETKGWRTHTRTNHDVKACELYVRERMTELGMGDLVEWVHFGRTSEDVNNVAYALMLSEALSTVLYDALIKVEDALDAISKRYASLPMLARTHGQPATPTTFGKEMAVFYARLERQMTGVEGHEFLVKWSGATGNHAAECAAYPRVEWVEISQRFVKYVSGSKHLLLHNGATTQIEPHDSYVELFRSFMHINTMLIGLCQDMWRYISDDWLVQKPVEGETGSSTMPHKVNPIDLENAEAHLGLANALFEHFARKLPISRLQRDLSDSAVQRYIGEAFGMSLIAYEKILTGLSKIAPNEVKLREVLDAHPEVITEAYQTILRSVGFPDPYGALKSLSRGHKITMSDLHRWVNSLAHSSVTEEIRARMLAVTPHNYIGYSVEIAERKVR